MDDIRDFSELGERFDPQLRAARYAMHMVRAVQYAALHVQGHLTEEQAQEEYGKAMENFDQLVGGAKHRNIAAEEREMSKGAFAVLEMVGKIKNG